MDTKLAPAGITPKLPPRARGQALVDAWRQSGLSQCAFARQQRVQKQRISYWARRLLPDGGARKVDASVVASPEFVQIAVQVPRSSPPPSQEGASMEILFPSGTVIRIAPHANPSLLRVALQAMGSSPC